MRLSKLIKEIRNLCESATAEGKCTKGALVSRARLELNDPEGDNCRWNGTMLAGWLNDGIRRIRTLRNDARYDQDGNRIPMSEITAETPDEAELPLYEDYFDALFYYVCARALSVDSEDTANQARSTACMENFALNIQNAPRLLTKTELVAYVNSGIKEIRRRRPEAMLDSRGRIADFENIPECGLWSYRVTGGAEISGSFDFICGWPRELYNTLYLETGADSYLRFYFSAAERAAESNPAGYVLNCEQSGLKTIQSGESGRLSGTIYQTAPLPLNALREISAAEQPLPLDDLFINALKSYICFKIMSKTGNEQAPIHYQNFTTEIYGVQQ